MLGSLAFGNTVKDLSFEPVLEFWFGTLTEGFADDTHRQLWFNGGVVMDDMIRDRFQHLIPAAHSGVIDAWLDEARGRLAFILVCDQFPRNIFRGLPDAFASDVLALDVSKNGIEIGAHRELGFEERAFSYLPFEHSEQLTDQHTCVELCTEMRDETPSEHRHATGAYLRHAHQHRDIIERFGRFPHRNVTLKRISSPEEEAFVADGAGFGQQPSVLSG